MASITYDYTGSNGTLPGGVTQLAPTAAIQSNELSVSNAAANTTAAATHTAYSPGSFSRLWYQYDARFNNETNTNFIPITNAGYTDYIIVILDPPDNQITIENEASSVLASQAFTLDSATEYRVRIDLTYGASGPLKVWVWRPGVDSDPVEASPTVTYNGDNTITSPVAEMLALAVNTQIGQACDSFYDDLTIWNTDPGWWGNAQSGIWAGLGTNVGLGSRRV